MGFQQALKNVALFLLHIQLKLMTGLIWWFTFCMTLSNLCHTLGFYLVCCCTCTVYVLEGVSASYLLVTLEGQGLEESLVWRVVSG